VCRLNQGTHVPEFVALSDDQENDMVQGRQFDFPKGSIVAFDKGYVDYQWVKSLTDKGVFFVTRLRAKAVYRIEARREVDRSKGLLSDQISYRARMPSNAVHLNCVV
jgi:Transposase DDE domain